MEACTHIDSEEVPVYEINDMTGEEELRWETVVTNHYVDLREGGWKCTKCGMKGNY